MRRTLDGEPVDKAAAAVKRDLWPVMKVGTWVGRYTHIYTHIHPSLPSFLPPDTRPTTPPPFPPISIQNDYKIWPIYDVLCFTMIPRHMQALSTGTLGICWAAYLSFVTHTDEPAPAPAAAK